MGCCSDFSFYSMDLQQVLGDEDYRILYDTGGMEAVEESKAEQQQGGRGGGDVFSQFFGGQQR